MTLSIHRTMANNKNVILCALTSDNQPNHWSTIAEFIVIINSWQQNVSAALFHYFNIA